MINKQQGFKVLKYFSPLRNCDEGLAKDISALVEQMMLECMEFQADFIKVKVEQIYEYLNKRIEEERKNQR